MRGRDNDSQLASGVGSDTVFGNEQPSPARQEAEQRQREQLDALVPKAQAQIDALNKEILSANQLDAFVIGLGAMPSELPNTVLAARLESRALYINYLVHRRNELIYGLQTHEIDVDNPYPIPTPLEKQITLQPIQKIVEPRPRGWRAIGRGICDLFGGSPMA